MTEELAEQEPGFSLESPQHPSDSGAAADTANRHRSAHRPVMLDEVSRLMGVLKPGVVIDATLGLGGHAERLLDLLPDSTLVGIDRDAESLEMARQRLLPWSARVALVHADFRSLPQLIVEHSWAPIRGIILDLGASSLQLDTAERGFSFRRDGPLDLRMDRSTGRTAADLINRLPEADLATLIRDFGEERHWRRIARSIVAARREAPVDTTTRLAGIIERTVPRRPGQRQRIHAATRTFQALRIAVNDELSGLQELVVAAGRALAVGGRMIVLAFHSLEDRPVKRAFRYLASDCECPPGLPACLCSKESEAEILTPRPLRPSPREVETNRRSRSARLRALERR